MKVSRRIPLDRLRPPETDIRQGRPEDQVASLAQSMSANGQLQPALVVPVWPDDVDDPDPDHRDAFLSLLEEVDEYRIVDGETRRQAARMLDWNDLWAWIWPEEPENVTMAQLDANTERISMDDYETVRALAEHKDATGKTLSEMAEETGYAESTLSQYFGALEAWDPLVEAWEDPDSPLELGHVLEINRLEDEDAQGSVLEHVLRHEASVSKTREYVRNKAKELRREAQDEQSPAERQFQGQADRADRETEEIQAPTQPDETCVICGGEAVTRSSAPVCQEDYGTLEQLKAADESFLGQAAGQQGSAQGPSGGPDDRPRPDPE